MANVFAFRSGRSVKNIDPQKAGLELERIRTDRGVITPEVVLEEATNPSNPLHAGFDWDDSAAAHKHRLNQARQLIVSVKIINGPVQTPIPAFVSVRTPEHGRNYVPTTEALSDEEIRLRVLQEVKQFAESMERRYSHFKEVADILARLRSNVG